MSKFPEVFILKWSQQTLQKFQTLHNNTFISFIFWYPTIAQTAMQELMSVERTIITKVIRHWRRWVYPRKTLMKQTFDSLMRLVISTARRRSLRRVFKVVLTKTRLFDNSIEFTLETRWRIKGQAWDKILKTRLIEFKYFSFEISFSFGIFG